MSEETTSHSSSSSTDTDAALLREVLANLASDREAERTALLATMDSQVKDRRRERRGKNLFRLFLALYLITILVMASDTSLRKVDMQKSGTEGHVAIVSLHGIIAADAPANAEDVILGLEDAFAHPDTKGVILRIDSPGGSPVQSGIIYDEMVRLRKKYPSKALVAVLEDLCASGGYYVAAAAEEIYSDKATVVGSIGVMMRGFGFDKVMKTVGVENRTITAGENKGFMDPFSPMNPEQRKHAEKLLKDVHQQFKTAVLDGRGDRLKSVDAELFSGLVWTGEQAVKLGLVDGIGSMYSVARERFGVNNLVDFSYEEDWMSRVSRRMGQVMMEMMGSVNWSFL
ncbi:MAG: S49 family peptidase [Magnetococcales bacterium]|nr:S49 family peptidase [Magnetococcales bacterium]